MENGFEVAFGPLDAGFAAAYAADVDEEIVQEEEAAVAVAVILTLVHNWKFWVGVISW